MRKIQIFPLVVVGLMAVFGAEAIIASSGAEAEKTLTQTNQPASAGRCTELDYQSDKCQCAKGEEHMPCSCKTCSGDGNCACITSAREGSGSITGTIKLSRAKAKTKGPKSYKDVVVYLEKVGENDFPPPRRPAKVDQKGLVFIPHVLAIQKGTPIEFYNNDNDKHNVYFLYEQSKKTKTKDLGTWKPGETRLYTFQDPKEVTMLCKLHLEMAAYVVILDNPFFTTVPIDGEKQQATFTIKNIPPGKYVLNTWHKKLKLKTGTQEVTVETGKTTEVDLTITKAKYAESQR